MMRARTIVRLFAVIVLSLIFGVVLAAGTAPRSAWAGSDSLLPYTVDELGITVPAGAEFASGGHVNIKTSTGDFSLDFQAKCVDRDDFECAGALHAAAQFIGQRFIPWSAFGIAAPTCVLWVQLAQFDPHFGEGGQAPLCLTGSVPVPVPSEPPVVTEPEPTPTPTSTSTPTTSPEPTPTSTPCATCALAGTGDTPAEIRMRFLMGIGALFLLALGFYALVLREWGKSLHADRLADALADSRPRRLHPDWYREGGPNSRD